MDELNDFLSRVNSCLQLRHRFVKVRFTTLNLNLAKILEEKGFIKAYTLNIKEKTINIFFRYTGDKSAFRKLELISKRSKKVYLNKKNINIIDYKFPHILTNSKGLCIVGRYYDYNKYGEILFKLII